MSEVHLSQFFETHANRAHHAVTVWAEYKDHPEWISQRFDDLRGHEHFLIDLALKVGVIEIPSMVRMVDPDVADNILGIVNDSINYLTAPIDEI